MEKVRKKSDFFFFLTLEKTDVYCGQSIWKWCIIMRCVVSHTCVKFQKGCRQISSGNSGSGSSDDGRCGGCVLLTLNVIFSSANHDAVFAVVHWIIHDCHRLGFRFHMRNVSASWSRSRSRWTTRYLASVEFYSYIKTWSSFLFLWLPR